MTIMCGIAGYSRAATHSAIPDGAHFARHLARAIEQRGPHATGFGWTQADGWPWYWKAPGKASVVAPLAPLPKGMRDAIVHTRWATKGDPARNENNHPVHAPGLILVHNGVLKNDDELIDLVSHERVAEVDSEALPALLALGPDALEESDPAELLALVKGDAAIAWLDGTQPGVLHLARLIGRPLVYGFTRRGDLVFASTREALRQVEFKARVRIDAMRDVPEGTYLRIEQGEVVAKARIRVPIPAWRKPAPQPQRPAQGKKKASPVIDGIDWDALAPRRGWVGYRSDPPQTGRTGRAHFDVKSQSWVVDE